MASPLPFAEHFSSAQIGEVPVPFYTVDGPETPVPADYDLKLKDWQTLSDYPHPTQGVARVITSLAVMNDGSENIVRVVKSDKKRYDLTHAEATPLATRIDGFNTYTAFQAAKIGIDTVLVGAPHKLPQDAPLQSHEAQVFSVLVDASHEEGVIDTSAVTLGGYSWAAMRAPLEAHYLKNIGIDVPLVITKDPCLAEKTGLADTCRDMTAWYIAKELRAVGKAMAMKCPGESPLAPARRAPHYLKTIGLSADYLKTHAKIAFELWQGEAGTFPVYMPEDTIHVVHFNTDSRFNDHPQYTTAIERHPLGRVVLENGVHLTPSDPRIVKSYVRQLAYGQELLDDGIDAADIADELAVPFLGK